MGLLRFSSKLCYNNFMKQKYAVYYANKVQFFFVLECAKLFAANIGAELIYLEE